MKPKQTPDVFRFIINPKAGRRNRANLAGEIEAVFASAPERADCQIILTEQPNHATQLAAGFASQFGERVLVFACGGDGTAREVAAGIAGTPATMSILPIGTANDFAKTMFSTTQLSRLMQLLPDPTIRCIDTIAIDDEICLNITSLGFDTKVQLKAVQLNQRVRILGNLAYPVAILLSLFGIAPMALITMFKPYGQTEQRNRFGDQLKSSCLLSATAVIMVEDLIRHRRPRWMMVVWHSAWWTRYH